MKLGAAPAKVGLEVYYNTKRPDAFWPVWQILLSSMNAGYQFNNGSLLQAGAGTTGDTIKR